MTTESPAPEKPTGSRPMVQIGVSLELIVFLLLILVAIALRLPDLNVIPLNNDEAHEALAVFRIIQPNAPGTIPISRNPLMFSANVIAMSIGGAENVAARIPTAALGVLIVASPVLFRRWVGPAYAVIAAGLLALSPVLLMASRSMSGAVWSLAAALFGLWCAGHYLETRRVGFAVAATSAALVLAVAAEPAGFLTLLGLGVGILFAFRTKGDSPETASAPDGRIGIPKLNTLAEIVRGWPWVQAVPGALLVLIAVGTVFLFYPPGLSALGESLGAGMAGFTTRPVGYPVAFPFIISLIYEPVLWFFGLAGAYFVLSGDPHISREREFIGRALVGWLVVSVALSLIYGNAQASHALWIVAPLVGLAAFALEKALAPVRDPAWQVPGWGPWLHGIAFLGILFIALVNVIFVGRAILEVTPALLPSLDQPESMKAIMIGLAALLAVITFFLVSSLWGTRAAWHGLGIGLALTMILYGFNVGWQAAVTKIDDPREPWHINPPSRTINLLVTTLREASLRATGTPYQVEIAVNLPPDLTYDSALGWALRNYLKTTYVAGLSPALNTPIVITPRFSTPPKLGAEYVGQSFALSSTWDRAAMEYWDFVPWLYNRNTRTQPRPQTQIIVWVRSDVYGVDPEKGVPTFPNN